MTEKIKLITNEQNFNNLDILLRRDWDKFYKEDFVRLKLYWSKIIVENIRKEKKCQ